MKRWLRYAKPYKAYFILGPLCMIIEVIGEVIMPMLLAQVINAGNTGTLVKRQGSRYIQHLIHIRSGSLCHSSSGIRGKGLQVSPGTFRIQYAKCQR